MMCECAVRTQELITVDVNGNFTLGSRKVLRPSYGIHGHISGYLLNISLDFFHGHPEDDVYRLPQMRIDDGALELDSLLLSCLLLAFNECCAESGGNIFEIIDDYGIYFEDIFMSNVTTRFREILSRRDLWLTVV